MDSKGLQIQQLIVYFPMATGLSTISAERHSTTAQGFPTIQFYLGQQKL